MGWHGMNLEEFREFATEVVQRFKVCVQAWQKHPQYNGDDRHPMVRATCYVLDTESWTIDTLQAAYGHFDRMKRKHMDGEPYFVVMPIRPTDPIHPYCALDSWNFPSNWNRGCESRKAFKKVFPRLARVVNAARWERAHYAQRDPYTKKKIKTKKQSFEDWLNRNPEHLKEMRRCGITVDDIWKLANNKLTIDDIPNIGRQQRKLF